MIRASFVRARLGPVAPVHGGVVGRGEGALQVDLDDGVPLVLGHREDHPVAQDAGVVDEHVEAAEQVDRLLHQRLGAVERRHVGVVGDRHAAGRGDLVDHRLGRPGVAAGAVARAAEVVHQHVGAVRGEQQRVLAADAPAGAGDDAHPSLTDPISHEPDSTGRYSATTVPVVRARSAANTMRWVARLAAPCELNRDGSPRCRASTNAVRHRPIAATVTALAARVVAGDVLGHEVVVLDRGAVGGELAGRTGDRRAPVLHRGERASP